MAIILSKPQSVFYSFPISFEAKGYGENDEMSGGSSISLDELEWDYENVITEDDEPVDNIFSEKQQRLLTESLYNAWQGPSRDRSFIALANVGLFYSPQKSPLVPDVLVSLDVELPDDIWKKAHRSYFISKYGKPPEVVIEVVSNRKGKEDEEKLQEYALAGVRYYVIFDPKKQLKKSSLRFYELRHGVYVKRKEHWLAGAQLGLTLWKGTYENRTETWLRWCDKAGQLMLTGQEATAKERQRAEQEQQRAEQERQRAEQEQQRAEQEQQRAEQERQRAEKLAAQLRALGIEPDST
jgi:hypothetical protein